MMQCPHCKTWIKIADELIEKKGESLRISYWAIKWIGLYQRLIGYRTNESMIELAAKADKFFESQCEVKKNERT